MSYSILEIKQLSQWFPKNKSKLRVLRNIDLKIEQGQFVAMVGGSGCGKSTLLRAILGTVPQKSGEVKIDDKPVRGPTRDVGIVYQHYSLYDFLTAEQNVAVGPKWDQTCSPYRAFRPFSWGELRSKHLIEARELLTKFKLDNVLKHYPKKLSGGQKQRVAIAQALIMQPRILLLDEPFGALDEATREQLQTLLLTLYQENLEAKEKGENPPWTVIIITHELNEALYVSNRIIGLSKNWKTKNLKGSFEGAMKIYDKPTTVFHPNDIRDYEVFEGMRKEIRQVVLGEGPEGPVDPNEHVTFWKEQE
jgi:NitT/TauT family transport system ATP-binding protein